MTRSFSLFLLSLALLSLSAPAWGTAIYVSGEQTGTWAADTVIVTAEVSVPPSMSRTILPGVEVLFSVYCKLIVDSAATLRAVGTSEDSIRFHALSPNTNWHGIRFLYASDSSRLEFCHLTQGKASGAGWDLNGGAIFCMNSSPTISSNFIYRNSAIYGGSGGGIFCHWSSPYIIYNTISDKHASAEGGGICCTIFSDPTISGNTISLNGINFRGGGISCNYSDPVISYNTIGENSASGEDAYGGGIYCVSSNPNIYCNAIKGNSAFDGGGIFCDNSNPDICANTIEGNSAFYGGGIRFYNSNPTINNNTLISNSGSGMDCGLSSATLVNRILWSNSPQQIFVYSGSPPQVNYSDIQGGYPGIGNINAYPAFVDTAQHDYRLQWGSPCIDTGDPNPIYNDPDLTRADMGAWYYDQSMPMRILLTPYNAPLQIPASGGSFQYAIQVTNIGVVALPVLGWCNVTLPSGNIYGPVLGPLNIALGAGSTLSRLRTQAVPAGAPAGMYHYNAYAVAAGDTSVDNFTFTKLGSRIQDSGFGGWTNTGEDFDGGTRFVASKGPEGDMTEHVPLSISPNPFNPTTAISYRLPAASHISLQVYDLAGRIVRVLVDGWREAGQHQVTFDGAGLASGVYLYRLQAGDFNASYKMVLMK